MGMRQNMLMAHVVQMGITVLKFKGTYEAAVFLRKCGVPFEVARRVLLAPSLRRESDPR